MILSLRRILPNSGLSSRTSNTYAGPGGAGDSGATRTSPSFPPGATTSSRRSSLSWMASLVMARMRDEALSYTALIAVASVIAGPSSGPTSLRTVILRWACLLFFASSRLTFTADMRWTSTSSTARILSSRRTCPRMGDMSFTSQMYAGPPVGGVSTTTPSFPAGTRTWSMMMLGAAFSGTEEDEFGWEGDISRERAEVEEETPTLVPSVPFSRSSSIRRMLDGGPLPTGSRYSCFFLFRSATATMTTRMTTPAQTAMMMDIRVLSFSLPLPSSGGFCTSSFPLSSLSSLPSSSYRTRGDPMDSTSSKWGDKSLSVAR
mmetsp:Transcript_9375/g.20326  ORF Transcript_9375/g.20326 Transcript_9375/m.20326 type:complete len:318 (+) Transcript_9375:272-1225(+)